MTARAGGPHALFRVTSMPTTTSSSTPSAATIDASLDAPHLAALEREWAALRDDPVRRAAPAALAATVAPLAKRVVAHRARLFDANAVLQAEAPRDDDPATVARIESNGLAIKSCTTMLTEMSEVLGRASVPSTG